MTNLPAIYTPLKTFIQPAWDKAELWRIAVMMLGFEAAFLLSPLILVSFLPAEAARIAYFEGVTVLAGLAQFASFGIVAIAFIYLLRLVHGRGFWSLMGDPSVMIVHLMRVTFIVALVLLVRNLLPPWTGLGEMRSLPVWIATLPFALFVILIQVSTEELYFRGYLQQQLACVSAAPLVWMGIPSVLFGLAHYMNGYGVADGVIWTIWATLLGVACADLTARTGTLGAAIGLHFANNIFATIIVGVQNMPMSGLALFIYPYDDPAQYDYGPEMLAHPLAIAELLILSMTVLVMWLAARIAIRR